MNALQFKTIRNSLNQIDRMFVHLNSNPTGKHINELEYNKRKYHLHCTDTLTQGTNVFKMYNLPYKKDALQTQCVYIITVNDRVLYAYACNIFAPASDAWHILTGISFSHYSNGIRQYKTNCKTEWLKHSYSEVVYKVKVINKH